MKKGYFQIRMGVLLILVSAYLFALLIFFLRGLPNLLYYLLLDYLVFIFGVILLFDKKRLRKYLRG